MSPARALAPVRPRRERRVVVRLWLPVALLWLVLAPLALLALPFVALVMTSRPIRPVAALRAAAAVLFALSGTLVEVEAPAASVRLRLI